jgi:hypothetical protein
MNMLNNIECEPFGFHSEEYFLESPQCVPMLNCIMALSLCYIHLNIVFVHTGLNSTILPTISNNDHTNKKMFISLTTVLNFNTYIISFSITHLFKSLPGHKCPPVSFIIINNVSDVWWRWRRCRNWIWEWLWDWLWIWIWYITWFWLRLLISWLLLISALATRQLEHFTFSKFSNTNIYWFHAINRRPYPFKPFRDIPLGP